MELLTDLSEATARDLAEEFRDLTGVLIERNLIDLKAEKAEPRPVILRKRHWGWTVVAVLMVGLAVFGGYAVVARAAGAYNESAAEMRKQANDYAAAKAAEDAKATAAEATAQAKADRELAQLKSCLHADVGEFLGGVGADPACNPKTPSAP